MANKRYTEYNAKIENPADAIRFVSSNIILAPFRLVNEYTKKIIFINRDLARKHLAYSVILNAFLIVSEIINIFIKRETIILVETNVIPGVISLVIIIVLYIVSGRLRTFDLVENPNPGTYTESVDKEEEEDLDLGFSEDVTEDIKFDDVSELDEWSKEQEEIENLDTVQDYGPTQAGLISNKLLDEIENSSNIPDGLFGSVSPEVKKELEDSVTVDTYNMEGVDTPIFAEEETLSRLGDLLAQGGY